ncbi:hypothetical protein NEQG_02682, partial [Nematocida parisii ERTm3]
MITTGNRKLVCNYNGHRPIQRGRLITTGNRKLVCNYNGHRP